MVIFRFLSKNGINLGISSILSFKGGGMMNGKLSKDLKGVLVVIGVIVGVWLFLNYLFPLTAPFFLAYFLVLMVHPLIIRIRKKVKINRGILSALIMLLILLAIGVGGYYLIRLLVEQLGQLLGNWRAYQVLGQGYLEKCCCFIEELLHIKNGTIENMLYDNVQLISDNVRTKVLPGVMESSWVYMKQTIEWFGALFIAFIAAIFMLNDYDDLHEKLVKIPYYRQCCAIKNNMVKAGKSFCKAQLIIMFLVGAICTLVFLFMGNPYCFLLGIGVGILDALPFFGTGIVLIPWAIIKFIQGELWMGILLLALYGVCTFIREFVEPKLMGNETGLPSLFFLATVYWGLYLFGIWGVFLGPLGGLLIKEVVIAILHGDSCPQTLTKP